ncbi:hypothetical protein PENTCL1PPCAC_23666, partial [Pristionchus entomophagus]
TECWECCECIVNLCPSRVIQRGRQHPLLIIRHPQKGWTVRALEDLSEGTFVSEYTGDVRTAWENRQLPQTYSIDLPCPLKR